MLNDLRLALRTLVRQPGFSAVAVLTLALGIGASAAIFSLVDHVVLRPMPYPDGDRMAVIWMKAPPSMGGLMVSPSMPVAEAIERDARSFDRFEFYSGESQVTEGPQGAEPITTIQARPSLFAMLGGTARLGRTLLADDMTPGAPRVAVISNRLWVTRFGGSRDVLEKDIRLDKDLHRIVGVMRPGFRVPDGTEDVWTPLPPDPSRARAGGVAALGVLKRGVTVAAATKDIARLQLGGELQTEGFVPEVVDPTALTSSALRRSSLVLFGAVGLLLLIGCANVAALLLTRNSARSRELAIRRALGATRGRLVRLLLLEAVVIAIAAGATGSIMAMWALEVFVALLPDSLQSIDTMRVDGRVLGFAALTALVTGLLFGLLPAFQGTRQELTEAMRGDARTGGATRGRHRTRRLLTAAEVALALVLMVGAGLLVRSLVQLQRVPLGFDVSNTLAVSLRLPQARYPNQAARQAFFDRLHEETKSFPGVVATARATMLPPRGGLMFGRILIEGIAPGVKVPGMYTGGTVSHNYFETMRIPVREGRVFGPADIKGGEPVLVINETMARKVWPGQQALGRRISLSAPPATRWATVVGVVADVKAAGIQHKSEYGDYQIYQSDQQAGFGSGSILLRTAGDPGALAAPLRARIAAIDPLLPLHELMTGDERVAQQFAAERFNVLLLVAFSVLGLLLAAIGIYGVMAMYVAQRRHEIGVRLALGASAQSVVRLVLKQSLAMALLGVAAGSIGAIQLTGLIKKLLFEVSPTDPLTFAVMVVVVLAVTVVSTLLPIRRAVRVNPAIALRTD
ncbi:MAG: ABC transporter permease [Acidobacteriota bacterium]|nr:ABC transporter permease [Acidobacteriota bacterium]